jgi:hypothetical protein
MNRLLVRLISVLISLSIMTSLIYIDVDASEVDDGTYLNTYAAHYFRNLTDNIGLNTEGSCTQVAVGMLLSFYDSYWSDDFISEEYDKKGELKNELGEVTSPGIIMDHIWHNDPNYTNYDDYINDNADKYFHSLLLQLSRPYWEEGSANLKPNDSSIDTEQGEFECSIDLYDAKNVIHDYFSLKVSQDNSFQSISSNITVRVSAYDDCDHDDLENPNSTIREEMIEKIKQGIPVIYCGYSSDSGRSMIAYDYDEINDKICFHTRWNSDTVMTDKDDTSFVYDTNTSILWFEISEDNQTHTHSYNYEYSDVAETETLLCACQMYSAFIGHVNNHLYIELHDSTNHFSGCTCGDKINVQRHDLGY